MIPHDYITEWHAQAPCVEVFQIEQDLVIGRTLVEMFSHPALAAGLAFRSGTALYKLYLKPPARHSENIDQVQTVHTVPEPAGPLMGALHEVFDPRLGKRKQTEGRVTFVR